MWKILVPVFCGLLVSGLLLYAYFIVFSSTINVTETQTVHTITTKYPTNKAQVAEFDSYWQGVIKDAGGKNAYATFKEHYQNLDSGEKHEVAHHFGGVLYETVGLEGISVCDNDFSYGCFHELITFAILDYGPAILVELNDFCIHSEYDCQHGIGHGILADFGYDTTSLNEALKMCQELGTVDEADGCFGGIFMEYNLRTIWGKDALRRSFDTEVPDTTCYTIPTYGQTACFFWSAQWYMAHSQQFSRTKQIEWSQDRCSQLKTLPQQLQCINGLGYEIGSYETDPILAIELCPKNGGQTSALFYQQCIISTLAGLNGSPLNRDAVRNACYQQNAVPVETCTKVLDSQDGQRIGIITDYYYDDSHSN